MISLSLGMMISESTCLPSAAMPSLAMSRRLRPSKLNGLVTTATVRMPSSRAICAMIGAAPVPVPPPMPAVMNTMSAPSSASAMRSLSSIAACAPMAGLAPAPRPLVRPVPSCSTVLAEVRPEHLRVGVGDDEIHAIDLLQQHVLDGVAAAAADADDLDDCVLFGWFHKFKHVRAAPGVQ